ncbi:TonB-dependent receptor domain-containing protein [Flavobacterium sp. '19STA2R22 D10 B1']|uniref:TonB-dependent receptor n=1 Tax=Flavobacterium aerium TaxID=3037261 RepID=UPI00278BE6C3|nr:TonB-dependent receptor [Flavobacterium sp. '19STA2R22 D10 B1']
MKKLFFILLFLCSTPLVFGQTGSIKGKVILQGGGIEYANINLSVIQVNQTTDANGEYEIREIPFGTYVLTISYTGTKTIIKKITINNTEPVVINAKLEDDNTNLDEVVVTGTMREVSRSKSPVPVEVYTPKYFQKNPTPSLFEAVGMINGVKPQLNCNVCNTGDIHINGMEGPYTMILIDGMPIVSSLSTVYGLSGIPNSLIERVEVVKGPGSSLYGSEAMGGIINVITKNPLNAPLVSFDVNGTNWQEYSVDASVKFRKGKATSLLGLNYYNYQNPVDKNNDGFTDVTLQNRISVFNKWNFERKDNRIASIAARYVYEDRWGGQMTFRPALRGSDQIYGESIYTARTEVIGMYQLPLEEKIYTQFSYNFHDQNSWYGKNPFMAKQQVAFAQAYWDKQLNESHNLLVGATFRYTYYDDNTPGTRSADGTINQPMNTPLPGVFVQDEWTINDKNTLLAGYRFDHDKNHGSIHSPRIAYKLSPNSNNTFRASFGTGFRVVNLFTEDHAALTGSREVEIVNALNPERSYNGNLNYNLKVVKESFVFDLDVTGFYSYFTNKIVGDFDTDPNKIIYDNIDGHAVSQGISVNTDIKFNFPLKIMLGGTYMDVFTKEKDNVGIENRKQQLHAPKWSGNFVASYSFPSDFTVDFTGTWSGPMRLPILANDYRPEYSPWFTIMNIQVSKKLYGGFELYGGVKNILDFVPKYALIRAFDPFDNTADDPVTNPNGYTFDTAYNYAQIQGARMFLGVRYNLY